MFWMSEAAASLALERCHLPEAPDGMAIAEDETKSLFKSFLNLFLRYLIKILVSLKFLDFKS